MTARNNAFPRMESRGAKDISTRALQPQAEEIPTNLSIHFLFTERGDTTDAHLVSGDSAIQMYGNSFAENGRYANHGTVMFNNFNEEGNAVLVQRLKPAGAKTATLRLSIDVLTDDVPTYERGPDGNFLLDGNGDKQPTGNTVPGHRVMWVISEIPDNEFGLGQTSTGSMTDSGGNPSTLYPFMDYTLPDHGDYGSLTGLRLSAPTTKSQVPLNRDVATDQQSYLFRVQFVERPNKRVAPNVIETRYSEQSTDFSLKPGAINPLTEAEIYGGVQIPSMYQDLDRGDLPPDYGPIGDIQFYDENIASLSENVRLMEASFTDELNDDDARYLANLFTGTTTTGLPYESLIVEGRGNGGVELTPYSTHYAIGGSDGDISLQSYDDLVRNELENFGDLHVKYLDHLGYPISSFWDSGFSAETKKAAFTLMGRRKDIVVVVGLHTAGNVPLSPSEESSLAIAIRAAGAMYPESDFHGTAACRAMIVMQAGKRIGSTYTGWLPMTHELARKYARYMGAGSMIWDADNKVDVYPNNEVEFMKNVTNTYNTDSVRAQDWANGLTWCQSSGRRTMFYPAQQTIYPEQGSVLNSAVNNFIKAHLEKVCRWVWRDLVGRTDLTPEQFLERSDEAIINYTNGLYDGRVTIEPRTYFTAGDAANGFSWSTDVLMTGSTMNLHNKVTIVSDRNERFVSVAA